jgi:hypothetical protein
MDRHIHGAIWYDSEEGIRIVEINLTHAAVASYLDSPAQSTHDLLVCRAACPRLLCSPSWTTMQVQSLWSHGVHTCLLYLDSDFVFP